MTRSARNTATPETLPTAPSRAGSHTPPPSTTVANATLGPSTAPSPASRPPVLQTDPSHWFLTESDILASRDGAARNLSVFTSGNEVWPLVDGEEFMAALAQDIEATDRGDFLHLTAWRIGPNVSLRPTIPATGDASVSELLRRAIHRGVDVRVLVSRNPPLHLRDSLQMRRTLAGVGGKVIIDARYPFAGSHHQKSAVLQIDGEAVAYCGGTDLAADRWDTRQHNSDPRRVPERYAAWHDVHARVRGPEVLDIEQNFRDRWNERKRPSFAPLESPPLPLTAPLPEVAASPGTQHVQVLRTFACKGAHYPSFAPAGEFSALAAYKKAISRARRYIYIEDQYLYSDDIAGAFVAALPNIEKLIIVVPQSAGSSAVAPIQHHLQAQFVSRLRDSDAGKVHIYHLVQPSTRDMIYVHSKVLLIDDIYAAIGSMNVNRRSATHDSELVLAVVDGAVEDGACRFARNLRLNLWAEHLSLPTTSSLIADPIVGITEWERQAATAEARVRHHVPSMPQRSDWRSRWVDPDGRCP